MPELLLEILSEEIPARMQTRAAADLKRLVCEGLKNFGLTFDSADAYVTPRRLTLIVTGLPEKQPDVKDERKGPQIGAPEQAIDGFLKSNGLTSVEECEVREVKGKQVYFVVFDREGVSISLGCATIIAWALSEITWPKSMKWGEGRWRWVRPIHSLLAIVDGKPLPYSIEPYDDEPSGRGIVAGSTTSGHRFMTPDTFPVTNFADYRAKLLSAKVMLDPVDRREKIKTDADALASAAGLTVKADDALLDEVAGLVEWPVVLMGKIDDAFMEVPPEVLIAAMRGHQKYFSCLDGAGKLASRFIVVSNMEAPDGGAAIIVGNERVLRARLSDTKFFWDQDRKHSLASRAPKLQSIIFHAKIGTLDEKIDRVQALASDLATSIPGADRDQVRSAARLAKADLTTAMVAELPELQGLMGRYYALNDGENEAVADAIAEHYSPVGPGDMCPSKPVSVAVALADKIDTLITFWAINEKPTGSKDPFALRRAALGVIRLIAENNLRLSLLEIFELARSQFKNGLDARVYQSIPGREGKFDKDLVDLLAFFADRLKVHLKEQGVRHDLIDAVFSKGEDDLVRANKLVDALSQFITSDDGINLLSAYKRAANIVKIEEKKDGGVEYRNIDRELFAENEEDTLWQNLHAVQASFEVSIEAELFTESMAGLAQLRPPIDAFFDKVTVNSDKPELRANRLALLRSIVVVIDQVADFSKIEG